MSTVNRRAAARIAAISVLLAAVAGPVAWYIARESTEDGAVQLAMEESRRLIEHFHVMSASSQGAPTLAVAQQAADAIIGGLFDIAEIYDRDGQKLAEGLTPAGERVEGLLPSHGKPTYHNASYESLHLPDGGWALRVFVPLRARASDPQSPIAGYFEGVRLVPDWQHEAMLSHALLIGLLAGLAALLCGAAIYPVVVHLSAENERKAREVLNSHISMMEALGRAIAKRDSDTGAHNYRVAWIAARIGEAMGVRGREMQALIAGSFLHDIGKIGIPDAILLKPGKLDDGEFDIMRTHVEQGERILSGIGWLEQAQQVVAGHHEKWNGQGYPRQLKGEAIALPARIFAVADVFDALCSKRPYKEPWPFDQAMAILERDNGQHFDPSVMAVFRPMARRLHDQLKDCTEDECRTLLEDRVRVHFGL